MLHNGFLFKDQALTRTCFASQIEPLSDKSHANTNFHFVSST